MHTHTAPWFSGVRGCVFSSKTKGFFFVISYIRILILIRDVMPVQNIVGSSPTPHSYTHTHAQHTYTSTHSHTGVWIKTNYSKKEPTYSNGYAWWSPPARASHRFASCITPDLLGIWPRWLIGLSQFSSDAGVCDISAFDLIFMLWSPVTREFHRRRFCWGVDTFIKPWSNHTHANVMERINKKLNKTTKLFVLKKKLVVNGCIGWQMLIAKICAAWTTHLIFCSFRWHQPSADITIHVLQMTYVLPTRILPPCSF